MNVGLKRPQGRHLLFAPRFSQATGCADGAEGVALCWPGTQELRMGSGIPKEEEGRLQTVYKETCVVLFLASQNKDFGPRAPSSSYYLASRRKGGEGFEEGRLICPSPIQLY